MKIHFNRITRTVWFRKETVWVSHNFNRGYEYRIIDRLKELNFLKLEPKYASGDGMAGDAYWVEISFDNDADEAHFILLSSDGIEI